MEAEFHPSRWGCENPRSIRLANDTDPMLISKRLKNNSDSMYGSVHTAHTHSAIIPPLMIRAVFSWRCRCGVRVKVIGETEQQNSMAESVVKCPRCSNEQIIGTSKVISVIQEQEGNPSLPGESAKF